MKTNTKTGLILVVSLILLSLFFGLPNVYALTRTSGGTPVGVPVREKFTIHQDKFPYATDLHFTLWQKESWIKINGWDVIIESFTESDSERSTDKHEVYVEASGANIPYCESVEIRATFWLTERNTKRIKDVKWTRTGYSPKKAVPDHGWEVKLPVEDPEHPGQYFHWIRITNDDSTESVTFTGFAYKATMDWYDDLGTIVFPAPIPDFSLGPGDYKLICVSTSGTLIGGHVYFAYAIKWEDDVVFWDIVDHPVTAGGVGGVIVPADKFGLLAPYIGLASTIVVATVAAAIYVKRVKLRKVKQ